MPDAARLIAALCICAVGYLVSHLVIPLMPESTRFGIFVYMNGAIGVVVGWMVMGKRAGRGGAAAISNGFGGVVMLVLWCLFLHACFQMFDRAMDNWYSGAFDALLAIFGFMTEYALILINPLILLCLIAGGVISGLATEYAWRKWC